MYRFSSENFKEITGVKDLPAWVKEIDGEEVVFHRSKNLGEVLKTGHIININYCERI